MTTIAEEFFQLVLAGVMMASLPSAAMPNCQPPASAGPVPGSVNAASTARRIPTNW